MESYDDRIFRAVAKLIHERDPELDEDETERQALELTDKLGRLGTVHSKFPQQPAPKQNELEDLQKKAAGLAKALENLSRSSSVVLNFFSGPKQLPDLSRLQLDAKSLGEILREGLKKKPPSKAGPKEHFRRKDLIEEAAIVFERASGINLDDFSDKIAHKSKVAMHKYFIFLRTCMPDATLYEKEGQFDTLKKFARRYLESRSRN